MRRSRVVSAVRWSLSAIAGAVLLLGACSFVWRVGYWVGDTSLKLYPGRIEVSRIAPSLRPGAAPSELVLARIESYQGWQGKFSPVWRDIQTMPNWRNGLVWPNHWSFQMPHLQLSVTLSIFVLSVPLWMPFAAIVAPTVWLWLRARRVRPGRCPRCAYDLTGNMSGTCPECGTAVTSA